MKQKIVAILLVGLALLALCFGVLWQGERERDDDLHLLAQTGAAEAYESFSAYLTGGKESDYWSGVASFYSFERAYYLMTEGTNKSGNYLFCNEVYGMLLLSPELCRAHMSEIVEAMALLGANVEDENGYLRLASLRHLSHA